METFITQGIYSVICQWLLADFQLSSREIGKLGEDLVHQLQREPV